MVEATIDLVELPTLYGGSLFFEIEHAPAVLGGWLDWTTTARDDISTSLAIIRFPDLDVVPPPLRGRHLLSLRFAYPGPTPEGADLAAPLRALAPVHLDALSELPASEIARVHNDPTEPGMSWVRGMAVSALDRGFVAAFLGAVGAHTSVPFVVVELRHIGGAARTDVADGSAVGARDTEFTLTFVGVPDPALFETVLPGAVAEVRGMLAPWLSESVPINWIAEPWIPEQYASAWSTPTRARLTQVRAAYDPITCSRTGRRGIRHAGFDTRRFAALLRPRVDRPAGLSSGRSRVSKRRATTAAGAPGSPCAVRAVRSRCPRPR